MCMPSWTAALAGATDNAPSMSGTMRSKARKVGADRIGVLQIDKNESVRKNDVTYETSGSRSQKIVPG